MRRNFDRQLAQFLRKKRGDLSYARFGKKVGLPGMTVYRIEQGEHHITLKKLETILQKLKVKLHHIFPGEF